MAADPRFKTNVERTRHHVQIDDIVGAWCAGLPLAAISERLARHDVPFSKVYSIADVMEDAHFRARGALIELQDPQLSAIPAPSVVTRFVGRTAGVPGVGPGTGQDNEAVYGAVGLDAEELERLRDRRVI